MPAFVCIFFWRADFLVPAIARHDRLMIQEQGQEMAQREASRALFFAAARSEKCQLSLHVNFGYIRKYCP
jgi:hypothetical protein